jgi:hypothetical protein
VPIGKIEGRIEVKGRRGRIRKQLLGDFKVTVVYWQLEEETLDRTVLRSRLEEVVDLS